MAQEARASRPGERRSLTLTGMTKSFAASERKSVPGSNPPPAPDSGAAAKSDPSGIRAALIESRAHLALMKSVFAATSDGIILADMNGSIVLVNAAATKIFQIEEDDAVDDNIFRVFAENASEHASLFRSLQYNGKVEAESAEIRGHHGSHTYALISLNYVLDPDGARVGIVAAIKDNSKFEALRRTDALTNIANRREFDEQIAKAYAMLERDRNGVLSLVFLDVDDFGAFNKNYGHQVGDEVLRKVGEVLGQGTRTADVAARLVKSVPGRYGGEEFVVILPGTDAASAQQVAERLRKKIADICIELEETDKILRVSASFGIATHAHTDLSSVKNLIGQANHAMKEAKTAGKNRCIAFRKA